MGIYLNPGNAAFSEAVHSQIYVDKTELISYTNSVLATNQKNICVSRPRRFGKSMVANMLAGERVQINTGTFSNDMTNFQGKDDVLTLLIHLGYLSYHWPDKTVTIPNKEVSQEYINAISTMKWSEVTASVEASKILLEALWNLDEKAVAEGIDKAHREISILQYNNKNAF